MTSTLRLFALALIVLPLGLLGGCSGPSLWETSFVRESTVQAPPRDPNAPMLVRQISFERISSISGNTSKDDTASETMKDRPPLSPAEAKATLLESLQYTGDAAGVEILGHSDFRTTYPVHPDSEGDQMVPFARTIGATAVVWGRRHFGKVERIVEKPITGVSAGSNWGRGFQDETFGNPSSGVGSPTWVPVKVVEDQNQFTAYYLRIPL